MAKEWYAYSEVFFNREQVFWILANLDFLERGLYPPEHKETGYAGKQKGGLPNRAYFENPCLLSAEIKRRLKVTKTDGKLLKAQVQGGIIDYELLEPEAQMALDYICIFDWRKRTRKTSYALWKAKRYYYHTRKLRYHGADSS